MPPSNGKTSDVNTVLGHLSEIVFGDPRRPMFFHDGVSAAAEAFFEEVAAALGPLVASVLVPGFGGHPGFEGEPTAEISASSRLCTAFRGVQTIRLARILGKGHCQGKQHYYQVTNHFFNLHEPPLASLYTRQDQGPI